jgi:hypothetical protein
MTAGPRVSASGERHVIARGIEAGVRDAALRLGSREPGAPFQREPKTLSARRCESWPMFNWSERRDMNSRRIKSYLNADDE